MHTGYATSKSVVSVIFFFFHILFKKIHLNKVACKLIVAASFVALSGKIQFFKKLLEVVFFKLVIFVSLHIF